VIRTITGDLAPGDIRLAHSHEHLLARPPLDDPDLQLDDEDAALADLGEFRAAGGDLLVEATTVDYGRDLDGLARLARASGVGIVATTGFNTGVYCRRFCEDGSPAELARTQVADVERGCGVVKVGTSFGRIEPWERVAAQAAATTHLATGVPVLTHTEAGTMAHAQLDLLGAHGVDPGAVILCHLDRLPDLDLHLSLIDRGATLSYDQIPKPKYATADTAVRLLGELAARGLADRVMAGGDLARRSYFSGHGGTPGLAWLTSDWRAGLDPVVAEAVFTTAPRRALALRG
jgi:predicted metal-dependent phosphotriesterase family hydrolase